MRTLELSCEVEAHRLQCEDIRSTCERRLWDLVAAKEIAVRDKEIAEKELERHKEADAEWRRGVERRCEENIKAHREIDAKVLADRTEYYEDSLRNYGCVHCKCKRCEAERNAPLSDSEDEGIFIDPTDSPITSPIRKISRGRGGDRRSKQFKKDRRERIRAIKRGRGARK